MPPVSDPLVIFTYLNTVFIEFDIYGAQLFIEIDKKGTFKFSLKITFLIIHITNVFM